MIHIRCSALGHIMTDPISPDKSLMSDYELEIAKKTKKTDAEKSIIQSLKDRSLSSGAREYMESLAKEYVLGFNEVVSCKYMDKGIIVEDQSIDLYNSVNFTDYKKNSVRLTNDWITGECDIIIPGVKGIDIKSSWSLKTFPLIPEKGRDLLYEWQCRGYMWLWDVPEWDVAYCMVNTPDELIKYEQEDLHFVDHIDERLRVTIVNYKRDAALEEKIRLKVQAAKTYLDWYISEIYRHRNINYLQVK